MVCAIDSAKTMQSDEEKRQLKKNISCEVAAGK